MKIRMAAACLYAISIVFFAWTAPLLYELVFVKVVDKTHLFYSPVDNNMIYTEQLLGRDAKAEEKSENHHSDVVYKNEKGEYFTRNEFEEKLPFIYYRNMDMRGLLPMTLHGQSFDSQSIQKERRVLEMTGRLLDQKIYKEKVYPLIESNPGQVALVLPADRIRFTETHLEFIDSDANGVDDEKTGIYTRALMEKGFTFPAKGVWGNFSTFKPFEGGIFVVDAAGKTFRLLRTDDVLNVTAMPFDAGIVPKKIVIAEAKDRKYLGLLLDTQERVYIVHDNDFRLTYVPTPHYLSQNMDFKLIMDPLFITAVYSDAKTIHAVAFQNALTLPTALQAVHSFQHDMSRSKSTFLMDVGDVLFPFRIALKDLHSTKGDLSLVLSPQFLGVGIVLHFLLAAAYAFFYRRHGQKAVYMQSACIVIFGIYILVPFLLLEQYKERNV